MSEAKVGSSAAEIDAQFFGRQSGLGLTVEACPSLSLTARRLFGTPVATERDLHEFVYFAALFTRKSLPSAPDRAMLRGGLAFLLCHFVPDEYDLFLIQRGNPETKLTNGTSKQARDTWAFMNYKRALSAPRSISYTAKSGRNMRQSFAAAVQHALANAVQRWPEFEPEARSLRSEQLAGRLLSSSITEAIRPAGETRDVSEFLSENYPDGSLLPFNTAFTKIWTFRNKGNVPWINRGYRRITPLSPLFPRTEVVVPVPTTLPGEILTMSVDVLTTRVSGFSEVRFKMVDAEGELCWPQSYPYGSALVVETRDFDPALIRPGMERVPERF